MKYWNPTDEQRQRVETFGKTLATRLVLQRPYDREGRKEQSKIGRYGELAWQSRLGGDVDWRDFDLITDPTELEEALIAPDIVNQDVLKDWLLHVKACSLHLFDSQYDSWTAGRRERFVIDPRPDDLLLLTYCEESTGRALCYATVPALAVVGLWKEAIKINKLAIYRKDVQRLPEFKKL